MNRRKLLKSLRWLIVAAVGLAGTALVVSWLMFQHIPEWYRPVHLPRQGDDINRAWSDLLRTQDVLTEWLVNVDEPFQHRFTAEQINAWLSIREDIWPLSREWMPPEFSDPFVYIDEQDFRVAVTYRKGDLKTVLNLGLEAGADEEGIRIRIRDVAGGSLRIPSSWVRDELARLDDSRWPAGTLSQYQLGSRPLPKLSELHSGAVFPNAWESWNVKRHFRITGIQQEPGALLVTIEPLPRATASR